MNDTEKLAKLVDFVEQIFENNEIQEYENYSGRGMYGKTSPFAFISESNPESPEGARLRSIGFHYDNLGLSYIYYLKYNIPDVTNLSVKLVFRPI